MRISDWSSDGCSSDLIHQHGRSGQNAGTGAHIDVAARINPAKAEIIDIRVPVAFGSRVREFSLYPPHGPANGDVISNSHAIQQTIDRLILPAIAIVDVTFRALMILAHQAFLALFGVRGIGLLREPWLVQVCGPRATIY